MSVVVDEIALELIVEGFLEFDQDAIASGLYTFEILDENGCGFTDSLSIPEPDSIAVTYAVTDVACAGEWSGPRVGFRWQPALHVRAGGPRRPGRQPRQLCAGGYVHNTTDGNGCSVADTVTVNGPDTIHPTSSSMCPAKERTTASSASTASPVARDRCSRSWYRCPPTASTIASTCPPATTRCSSPTASAVSARPSKRPWRSRPTLKSCRPSPDFLHGAGDGVLVVNAVGGSGALQLTSPFVFAAFGHPGGARPTAEFGGRRHVGVHRQPGRHSWPSP